MYVFVDGVVIRVLCTNKQFNVHEKSLSYLDLLNAKEILITNVISGAKWVREITHSNYSQKKTIEILKFLNSRLLI